MFNYIMYTRCFCAEERYGRECRVVSVDFSGGQDIYEELSKKLLGLDIGVLGKGVQ